MRLRFYVYTLLGIMDGQYGLADYAIAFGTEKMYYEIPDISGNTNTQIGRGETVILPHVGTTRCHATVALVINDILASKRTHADNAGALALIDHITNNHSTLLTDKVKENLIHCIESNFSD